MPLIKIGQIFPVEAEILSVDLVNVSGTESIKLNSEVCAIFIVEGSCSISYSTNEIVLRKGESIYIQSTYSMSAKGESTIIIISGNWGYEIGSSGFFAIENNEIPENTGDPVPYKHFTKFDNHYHDFDEVWIILEGSGIAYSEGIRYEFERGDCIFTRMGEHHDLQLVKNKVTGIYFETTLKGKKRLGHLWNHTHGPASPGGEA